MHERKVWGGVHSDQIQNYECMDVSSAGLSWSVVTPGLLVASPLPCPLKEARQTWLQCEVKVLLLSRKCLEQTRESELTLLLLKLSSFNHFFLNSGCFGNRYRDMDRSLALEPPHTMQWLGICIEHSYFHRISVS